MGDYWNPTGDQFVYQSESVYPIFSDIDTSDFNLAVMQPRGAVKVLTPEGKLRASQYGVPAYVQNCQCNGLACGNTGSCNAEYKQSYAGLGPKDGQPRPTYLDLLTQDREKSCNGLGCGESKENMVGGGPVVINIDDRILTLLLIIIVVVFVCCCCKKYIHHLTKPSVPAKEAPMVPLVTAEETATAQ